MPVEKDEWRGPAADDAKGAASASRTIAIYFHVLGFLLYLGAVLCVIGAFLGFAQGRADSIAVAIGLLFGAVANFIMGLLVSAFANWLSYTTRLIAHGATALRIMQTQMMQQAGREAESETRIMSSEKKADSSESGKVSW